MDILFLDANVLFSAAYREKSGLVRLWDLKDVRLVTSAYALEEAKRNLTEAGQKARLERLVPSLQVIPALTRDQNLPAGITLPAKDKPILLAAIESKATHLLTGDFSDFGRYYGQTIGGVLILPPGNYLSNRIQTSRGSG